MEKPLNRNTALHISSKEWDEITGRNDRKKLEAEAIAKEQAKKKYMKESSQAMIDSWENSLLVRIHSFLISTMVVFVEH